VSAVPGQGEQPLRVMIVDDHPIWREALERDLRTAGLDVVATAGDGEQALRRMAAARPDVVVLDLRLPVLDGVETTRRIAADHAGVRVLILSASGEEADVLAAIKAGATGYLVKSASRDELLEAVRRTAAGDAVFTPGLAGLVLGEFRRMMTGPGREEEAGPRLTERETEILRLVAKGLSSRQIAERLVLSHRTVQNHTQNVLAKLQLHNRVELTRYAIERGLDDSTPS
jgi:DNA-binding NarL/FixJ family response regulator